jgi:arylsulfatase A-like enzyme
MYGTNAIELEDTYLRLDLDIAELLKFLDSRIGQGNYLLFLTADHGAVMNPLYAKDKKIHSGVHESYPVTDSVKKFLNSIYGEGDFVMKGGGHNIYLNRPLIYNKKLSLAEVQTRCVELISRYSNVAAVVSSTDLAKGDAKSGLQGFMQNGYNTQRSGDILMQLQPGWIDWSTKTGTSHGAAYSYDTHVPLIFFGTGIRHDSTSEPVVIPDIAPTIAAMLGIEFPNGCTGTPIRALVK